MSGIVTADMLADALELLDRDVLDETDETEQAPAYSPAALGSELHIAPSLADAVLRFLVSQGRATPLKAHGAIVYSRAQDGDVAFGAVNRVVPVLHGDDQAADEHIAWQQGGWRFSPFKTRRNATLGANLKRA